MINFDTRPGPVSAICVIWTLYTVYGLYNFTNAPVGNMPEWFMFYYIGISAGYLVGIVGMWQMRRWGLMLFGALVIIEQGMLIGSVGFNPGSLMLPLLVILVGGSHFQEMR